MANPNPPETTRFKAGNKAGHRGRPKGLLRVDDVKRVLGSFWRMTKSELKEVLEDDETTMGQLMIAAIMAKAAREGDANRLSFLLDRGIGKPRPEPEDISTEPFIVHKADGGRVEMGSKRKKGA
jgi:hypothetical protein